MAGSPRVSDFLLAILAVMLPPLPVWIKRGFCSADGLINIVLSFVGFLPGVVHALYIIYKYPDEEQEWSRNDIERNDQYRYNYQSEPHHYQSLPPPGNYQSGSRPANASSQHLQSNSMTEGTVGGAPLPPSYAAVVKGDNKIQT